MNLWEGSIQHPGTPKKQMEEGLCRMHFTSIWVILCLSFPLKDAGRRIVEHRAGSEQLGLDGAGIRSSYAMARIRHLPE